MTARAQARVVISYFSRLLRAPARRIALHRRFPTCEFYEHVSIDGKSILRGYNVIFEGASICGSDIGAHTYVQKRSSLFNCTIGKFCSIASDVSIGLGTHPVEFISTHPAFYSATQPLVATFAARDEFDPFAPITIGNDVWIGQGALVMDGVEIGDGAVIGARAVVTRDVAPYAIVAGVPAKTVRYRFDPDTIERLRSTRWWTMPDDWLAQHYQLFSRPAAFLQFFQGSERGGNVPGSVRPE